jgi:hypothetical protein
MLVYLDRLAPDRGTARDETPLRKEEREPPRELNHGEERSAQPSEELDGATHVGYSGRISIRRAIRHIDPFLDNDQKVSKYATAAARSHIWHQLSRVWGVTFCLF